MKQPRTIPSPLTLAETRTGFEQWRQKPSPRGRIPAMLWEAAVALVPQHGLTAVSRALRLSYAELKRRCEAPPQAALSAGEPPSAVSFVALPAELVSRHEPFPICLEVTSAGGASLRLTLPDSQSLEPVALITAFLRGAT